MCPVSNFLEMPGCQSTVGSFNGSRSGQGYCCMKIVRIFGIHFPGGFLDNSLLKNRILDG